MLFSYDTMLECTSIAYAIWQNITVFILDNLAELTWLSHLMKVKETHLSFHLVSFLCFFFIIIIFDNPIAYNLV